MTFAAAIAQLKNLSFTGLQSNNDVLDQPPHSTDLPALVIEIPLYSKSVLSALDIANSTGIFHVFINHSLLIQPKTYDTPSTQWNDIVTYLDRYLAAIQNDMTLNDNLDQSLNVDADIRTNYWYRRSEYIAIIFKHSWRIKQT